MTPETITPEPPAGKTELQKGRLTRRMVAGWAAALLVLLAGLAATMSGPEKYHGDEGFYTDAAIGMVQTGHYWTPKYPDGSKRLNKPIVTYWAIGGSFRAFGISLWSSRLPAVIAGGFLLGFAFYLGRIVFGSARVGVLTALVTASNLEMLRLSTRATPDVFLCLFVLVSMCGFARIWFQGDRSWWGALMAFGGMGLAVQTKGFLGLAPLAANILFFVWAKPNRAALAGLWKPAAILAGLAISLFWYAEMLRSHGASALRDFVDDQVSAKVSTNPLFFLASPLFYIATVLQYFHVWIVVLVAGVIWARPILVDFFRARRRECIFLLSLLAILIVAFSFGNMRRARYLAAGYPLAACVIAGLLDALARHVGAKRWSAAACLWLGGVIAVLGLVVTLGGFSAHMRLVVAGLLLLALGVWGIMSARGTTMELRWAWIASVFIVGFIVHGACIRPLLWPSALPVLTRELLQLQPRPQTVYVFEMKSRVPGIIRVMSGGKLRVKVADSLSPTRSQGRPSPAVSYDPEVLKDAGYAVQRIAPPEVIPKWLAPKREREAVCWLGIWQHR